MTDTKRLYYEDVYIKEFSAKVVECRKGEKGFQVILDRSAFYPEGGGQPCDLGILGGTEVTDVQEKNGELIHYVKAELEPGTEVTGRIDWQRRFDLMQQHSGEHIVSGLVHEAYGYNNAWSNSKFVPDGVKYFGQMTVPRELTLKDNRLIQKPVRELEAYRSGRICHEKVKIT